MKRNNGGLLRQLRNMCHTRNAGNRRKQVQCQYSNMWTSRNIGLA